MNVALVMPGPLNPMLFVVKAPYGPEWYQAFVPQSIRLAGYWPFSTWFWPDRSSNVTACKNVAV